MYIHSCFNLKLSLPVCDSLDVVFLPYAPFYALQKTHLELHPLKVPPIKVLAQSAPPLWFPGSMRILPVCVWAMGSPFGEIPFGLRIVLLLSTLSFLHISLVKGLSPRLWGNPYVARALGFCF